MPLTSYDTCYSDLRLTHSISRPPMQLWKAPDDDALVVTMAVVENGTEELPNSRVLLNSLKVNSQLEDIF